MRLAGTALLLVAAASPALAQRAPEIVIPGKAGVPVYINGIDASYGIVEGEFGLDRPGLMAPTVVYRPLLISNPTYIPGYYPKNGQRPGYGRLEIIPPPNRPLPPPAPTYYRSWSSSSGMGPVTIMPPNYQMPNLDVYAGWGGGRRHRGGHGPKPPAPSPKGP
jgi:hypothetical protein